MNNLAERLGDKDMRLADLARAVGVDRATAWRWAQKRIPAERVAEVERVTGIPRHELRPDLYEPAE